MKSWIAICCAAMIVGGCGVERVEVTRLLSPDGQIVAVLYETNGGATTSFGYEVEVSSAGASREGPLLVSKLYGAVRNDTSYGANLRWATNSELRLEYLNAKSGAVLLPRAQVGDRTVVVALAGGIVDPMAPAGGMAFSNGAREK